MSAVPASSVRRSAAEQHPPRIEIVPSRQQRRARPRLLAAIVTVGGLFAILAAQLLLTIATSDAAYEISSLQAKQSELARDEQVVVEKLRILEAPQHLAAEAQAMGMVASSSTALLNLADSTVLGAPVAASASSALMTAPDGSSLIPNALLFGVPLVGAAEPTDIAAGAPVPTAGHDPVASVPPGGIPSPITR
ncbi:MAG: hypothetical protein JWL94_1726 [Microbacteriaceae bacterium]|jgi:hypothetical protein|nr:hypothetical protein [Microbacteriaceae bacterium]HEV7957048.1 hypothetical protein [Marisediminicola sp.]